MNVNLGPVFDKLIADLLSSGEYQSQSEVVREGLRLRKQREEIKQLRLDEMRHAVALGGEQADRGELTHGHAALTVPGRGASGASSRLLDEPFVLTLGRAAVAGTTPVRAAVYRLE